MLVYLSNAIEKYCKESGFVHSGKWHKWASYGFDSDGILVMDEFFWNEYKFSSLYSPESDTNADRVVNSKKLIYVACSRAISGLVCVKVLTSDEEYAFKAKFPSAELV